MIPLMILSYLSALASIRPDFIHVFFVKLFIQKYLVLNVKRKDTSRKKNNMLKNF